jgi:methionine-rich copper-binding protein CopC
MMLQIPVRRLAATLLGAWLAVLLFPGLVAAHAELVTATPADKSTVTQPVTEVSGIYSESMSPNGSSIVVKDASGATVAQGTVDPAKDTRMVATPTTPLGSGAFTVQWTSVALDGHLLRGTWVFTVAVAPTVAPTPVPSAAPSAAATASAAAPSPSTAPTPAPSAAGTTGSDPGDVALPILVALIVLAAGAAYLLSRRNRPSDPT